MVETERIELSSAGCRPAVLPLNDVPMVAEVGIEPDLMAAYETAVCTSSSSPHQNQSASKLVDRAGIEPATFRVSDGCTACRALGRWSPAPESNGLLRFTGAAHRQQCLQGPNLEPAERIERSSVAYHATALPLSYTGWSRRADSNRHLSFTRAPFFPLNYFDNILGASNRIRTGVRTMARSNPSR